MNGSEQKRAILAVVLSGLVLFLWQSFFAPNNPGATKPSNQIQNNINHTSRSEQSNLNRSNVGKEVLRPSASGEKISESSFKEIKKIILSDGLRTYTISSNLYVSEVENKDAIFNFFETVGNTQPFQILLQSNSGAEELFFNFEESFDRLSLIGKSEKYDISLKINITNQGLLNYRLQSKTPYKYRLQLFSKPGEIDSSKIREFIYFTEDVNRTTVGDSESAEGKVKWFGIDFNYHFSGFVFDEKQSSKIKVFEQGHSMVFDLLNPLNELKGDFVFLKKNYDTLKNLNNQLDLTIDFGIFGIIAVPMLRSLQFLYKYIPNYGLALIVLTIFIRMLLFPLSFTSFKSMKKMQKIQPELAKLKEKFKDDPQRMQKETMELFKRGGANPLGGCLPMLLQMPIFFAFYQVLYGAVELVGAPFFGWIHDLSIKDPYYVLPVLMAMTMFAQQKITPATSADPTQQKVMMFMPLIFGFIMKDLPAGLNLYIAVSTLFGIGQQLLVYRMTD